jgi:hypothetical protein
MLFDNGQKISHKLQRSLEIQKIVENNSDDYLLKEPRQMILIDIYGILL